MTDHDTERQPSQQPDRAGINPNELASLAGVLHHPQHTAGLHELEWTVTRVERVLPGALVRVHGTLSGEGEAHDWDGENIAVRLELPEPPAELSGIPGAPSTSSRIYTIAECSPASRTITIDFVQHDHDSPAMRWLSSAGPGSSLRVRGPRPHRVPGPGSPVVLLADSSALPAARSILRRRGGHALLFAAVNCAAELSSLDSLPGLEVRHIEADSPSPLATAFKQFELPAQASVWAAGERDDMRGIRQRCRELGLPKTSVQVFGYWKRGVTNTSLDIERLRAAKRALEAGEPFLELDGFEGDEPGSGA